MNFSNQDPIIKDDNINIIGILKTIWIKRITIYYTIGSFLIIGLIWAFASPVKYSASVTLLPSVENQSSMSNLGALAGMASMAGLNLGGMMGNTSGIPTEIYPEVIKSYPFLSEFLNLKFNFSEYKEPLTMQEYVNSDTIKSVGDIILAYTIRLPWTIKDNLFSSNENFGTINNDYGVLNISFEEFNALMVAQSMLQVESDIQTGLVTVRAEAKEPLLAAEFAKEAVDLLQKYIIEFKTKQVRENLDFIQKSYDEKKSDYKKLRDKFLQYKDRHRNVVSERIDIEFQQLNDEYDIAVSMYKSLAQQLEQAKISVKEETPAFSVIEPAIVPYEKSSPNRKLILVFCVLLGGMIGLGIIFGNLFLKHFIEKWKSSDELFFEK
ncbi:MAG: lipopolysaccharide biosynthesis protein [Marinilabiliaceae bacterium]|nr:lipopolysaccharide biosynthesis protein [Marinilabiliaceae bacterium]